MGVSFGSICSGIESASVAWEPLGMTPLWFAEIEKFPSAVLAHHWPHVANFGDMCALPAYVASGIAPAPDVLVGGTPCQAFSIAGKRGGLGDERGQLTLKFVELANEIDKQRIGDECVVVWENVPGVLSSHDNAFGCFLGALAGDDHALEPGPRPVAGKSNRVWRWSKKYEYHVAKWSNAGVVHGPKRTIAWRILDAQYFGVAQRRRRVFVVASARDGFDPCQVLFERESVRRDTPPSREEKTVASALTSNGVETCGADDNQAQARHLIPTGYRMVAFGEYADDETASVMKARDYKDATDLVAFDVDATVICPQNDVTPLNTQVITRGDKLGRATGFGLGEPGEAAYTISAAHSHTFHQGSTVRRLTPVECERLQGFPDNHTRIPWRGKAPEDCPDGPRYKAIGNSKARPVVQWLGKRILEELSNG